jgi:integrase
MPEWRITRLNGEFCVTWDDEGGIRRRYRLGTTDAKEAARRATSRYAELTRPKGSKVKDVWAGYCHAKQGLAVIATMKHTWKALAPRFAEMEATAITVDDCRAHTADRRAAKISDGTIHTELGHLRMTLKWAENNGMIARAPHVERPSKPEPKDYYITRAEAKRLMDAAKVPHIALAIRLMLTTGARVTAALELTWDRVDFDRGMVNLRNPFDSSRRKGRASIPMNDVLRTDLEAAKVSALSPFVIEWGGVPVKSIKKGLRAAAIASRLPDVTPHVLRHSAAVWLVEDGHPMSEVAQFLGHSNTRMTEKVYGRYSPDHLRTLASSLSF